MPEQIDNLVPPGEGLVSRSIFVDDEIFRQEMRQIFSRAWLFVGHEGLIPKPDDYFSSRMGTDPSRGWLEGSQAHHLPRSERAAGEGPDGVLLITAGTHLANGT